MANERMDKLLDALANGWITPICMYVAGLEDAARACDAAGEQTEVDDGYCSSAASACYSRAEEIRKMKAEV